MIIAYIGALLLMFVLGYGLHYAISQLNKLQDIEDNAHTK